jgi:CHAT domain-containing protein
MESQATQIGELAREQSFESLLKGDKDEALDILDEGLQKLGRLPRQESLPQMIKIMGDMGQLGDAQAFLDGRILLGEVSKRQIDDPLEDPQLRFQRNLDHANETLELACCIQDWDVAKEIYRKEAGLIPFFLEVDIDKPLAIFDKLREMLYMGRILEDEPMSTGIPSKMLALQCYHWGCFLSNVFHKHFNRPASLVTILDHDFCSALFISAARLCCEFAEMDVQLTKRPKDHKEIKPLLDCTDWNMQALVFLEKGKARSLLDSIVQHKVSETSESTLMERANTFARAVNAMTVQLSISKEPDLDSSTSTPSSSPMPTPPMSPPNPRFSKRFLSSISSNSLERIRRWQRAILAVGGIGDNPIPTKIESKDIQKILLHLPSDTAIVEFGIDSTVKGSLVAIAMTRNTATNNDIVAKWQHLDRSALTELKRSITVLRWYMHYQSHEEEEKKKEILELLRREGLVDDEDDMKRKHQLARQELSKLLEPFRDILANKSNLIVVPSNNLSHIPWSMIPFGDGLLVDFHSVSMIPSLCIWNRLRLKHGPPQESPKVLIVTNSPFETPNGRIRKDGIQYSRVEALHLARLHHETPCLADELDSDDFFRLIQQSRIVHISAHGDFDTEFPLKSKIHLGSESLSVMDFRELHLQASLVVFSTCLSGLSRTSDSGSSFSFAHALLGSGAKAFIGTLWPVNDVATCIFMILFYEKLRQGLSPVEAMRGTKLMLRVFAKKDLDSCIKTLEKLLEYPDSNNFVYNLSWRLKEDLPKKNPAMFRHEQYWAPFVLTGYGNSPTYKVDFDTLFVIEDL